MTPTAVRCGVCHVISDVETVRQEIVFASPAAGTAKVGVCPNTQVHPAPNRLPTSAGTVVGNVPEAAACSRKEAAD